MNQKLAAASLAALALAGGSFSVQAAEAPVTPPSLFLRRHRGHR